MLKKDLERLVLEQSKTNAALSGTIAWLRGKISSQKKLIDELILKKDSLKEKASSLKKDNMALETAVRKLQGALKKARNIERDRAYHGLHGR